MILKLFFCLFGLASAYISTYSTSRKFSPKNQPQCPISGFRFLHLDSQQSLASPHYLRIVLVPDNGDGSEASSNSSNERFSLSAYDFDDRMTGNFDFILFKSSASFTHFQFSWELIDPNTDEIVSTFQSEWGPVLDAKENTLELKFNLAQAAIIAKLNNLPLRVYRIPTWTNRIDHENEEETLSSIEKPAEWLEIEKDLENVQLTWKSALKELRDHGHDPVLQDPQHAPPQAPQGHLNYFVFEDNAPFHKIQISNAPLPKHPAPRNESILESFRRLWSSSASNLPVVRQTLPGRWNQFSVSVLLAASGFTAYLVILLSLSRMTSIRYRTKSRAKTHDASAEIHAATTTGAKGAPRSSQLALLESSSHHLELQAIHSTPNSPKSNDNGGNFFNPSAASSCNSNTNIHQFPLNLNDNRHILFPSKLRNFQK